MFDTRATANREPRRLRRLRRLRRKTRGAKVTSGETQWTPNELVPRFKTQLCVFWAAAQKYSWLWEAVFAGVGGSVGCCKHPSSWIEKQASSSTCFRCIQFHMESRFSFDMYQNHVSFCGSAPSFVGSRDTMMTRHRSSTVSEVRIWRFENSALTELHSLPHPFGRWASAKGRW